jgi:hypothetical protein
MASVLVLLVAPVACSGERFGGVGDARAGDPPSPTRPRLRVVRSSQEAPR